VFVILHTITCKPQVRPQRALKEVIHENLVRKNAGYTLSVKIIKLWYLVYGWGYSERIAQKI